MIHYIATTASGSYIKYAFHGTVSSSADVERALGLGSRKTRGVPCSGHDLHDGDACRCAANGQIVWAERAK